MLMQPWNPGPIKRRSPLHDYTSTATNFANSGTVSPANPTTNP
jgi:hypothetical protein